MKQKIIKTIKDVDSLTEGEIGIEKKGIFKWQVVEAEKATKVKPKSRS